MTIFTCSIQVLSYTAALIKLLVLLIHSLPTPQTNLQMNSNLMINLNQIINQINSNPHKSNPKQYQRINHNPKILIKKNAE